MSPARAFLALATCTLLALAVPALAGGPITSGLPVAGTLPTGASVESWTFSGALGDRIVVAAVTTSGALNTVCGLRTPGGTLVVATAADRWEYQLTQGGTWTLEITDSGANDAGGYLLAYTNLTAGPLTNPGDLDGGAIASGEVRAGTTGGVADLDAFTFSGTAGQHVLFAALESSGASYNTALYLYGPNGVETSSGGGNRLDHQLQASGTYTVLVEDVGNDHTGGYTVSFLNVTGGPLTTGPDPDGGAIASGSIASGTMNGVVDFDGFTFGGATGDRIVVTAVATGGAMNTTVYLYPPNGAGALVATAADRWEYQLTQNGTWTLVVEDSNFGETGTYSLAVTNMTAGPLTNPGDLDGGAIASGEVRAGTTGGVADLDAFTFSGTAGQHVLFAALESSGLPYNTALYLYGPNGVETSSGGGNRLDHQLQASGTYTVLVEDVGNDHTGGYTVSFLNVTGGPLTTGPDPDGGAIASGSIASGTMNGVVDFDGFTFGGATGDRIVVTAVATGGSMNTTVYLYPPNGAGALVATAADRWEYQLTQNGTWTLVIEDASFGETGTYALAVTNLTAGPLTNPGDLDGGAIASGEVRAGTTGAVADLDAFTFSGTAGDRIVFAGLATGGASYNSALYLYGPNGIETSSGGGDRLDHQLQASGTYTVLVEDVGNDHAGSYAVTFLNVTAGPLTTAGDLDGGWITSGQVKTGTVSPAPDLDVFWFNATTGDTAIVQCVTTSGTLNTTTYLYPPGGLAALVATAADNWTYAITTSGRYALLVQHSDLSLTGGYQLGLSGPITTVDVPGGAAPARLTLSAPGPNPSRGAASFTLALPARGRVEMRVYDVRGALVRTVADGAFESGTHTLAWDGRGPDGRRAPSGVYMVQVRTSDAAFTRRVVRIE